MFSFISRLLCRDEMIYLILLTRSMKNSMIYHNCYTLFISTHFHIIIQISHFHLLFTSLYLIHLPLNLITPEKLINNLFHHHLLLLMNANLIVNGLALMRNLLLSLFNSFIVLIGFNIFLIIEF